MNKTYKFSRSIQILTILFTLLMCLSLSDDASAQGERGELVVWNPINDVIAHTDGYTVQLYENDFDILYTQTLLAEAPDIEMGSFRIAWSPNGDFLAVGHSVNDIQGGYQNLYILSGIDLNPIAEISGYSLLLGSSISWSHDSTKIAVVGGSQQGSVQVYIFDFEGNLVDELIPPPPTNIDALAWSSNGQQIAIQTNTGLEIWDYSLLELADVLPMPYLGAGVAFNPDPNSNEIAFVNREVSRTTVEIWNTNTGQRTQTLEGHTEPLISVGWGSGGIITVGRDGITRVWDSTSGNVTSVIYTGVIFPPSWNSAGTQFVTTRIGDNNDGGIFVYDESTGGVISQKLDTSEPYVQSVNLQDMILGSTILHLSNDAHVAIESLEGLEIAIESKVANLPLGSIVFTLNGVNQTDNTLPYQLTGWTPEVGTYNLMITPFTASDGTGTQGIPYSIQFSIFESNVPCDIVVSANNNLELISAINTANSAASPYTICLENSTYTFNTADNSNPLGANALPVITGEITIIGNGATITRDASAPDFRFFRVVDGANLTLENLTLNGRDPIDNAGMVRLRDVRLVGE